MTILHLNSKLLIQVHNVNAAVIFLSHVIFCFSFVFDYGNVW